MPSLIISPNLVHLTIDPTSKAARAALYNASGVESLNPTVLPTYFANTSASVACGAAPTDVFCLLGSPSARIKVTSMWISTIQATGAGINRWFILKRNTPNIGGTFAFELPTSLDSNDRLSGATVWSYTAKPTTLGSLALDGTLWAGAISSPLVTTADIKPNFTLVNFMTMFGKPITLDDETESLCWNMAGATIANSGTAMGVLAGASWIESLI